MGAIVAKRLSLEGVNLTLTYRKSREQVLQLQKELAPTGVKVEIIRCDVSNEKDVVNTISKSVNHMGDLWFTVNLASEFREAYQYDAFAQSIPHQCRQEGETCTH